ncbi:MAG: DUF488 domain-containing protein [Gemmataceae bacterium]
MQPENTSFPIAHAADLAGRLFTVGHSNHEPEAFLALLRRHGVTAVADVRSSPYSRRMPHFSRGSLEATLGHHGIAYVFLGQELGGRPTDEALYHPDGWADYERVRSTAGFARGVERVLGGLQRYTVALMCGEEDPIDCHRGLMVTPALKGVGLPPRHIRRDRLESTEEFEQRVQDAAGVGALFGMDEAYRLLNGKKAYRRGDDPAEL